MEGGEQGGEAGEGGGAVGVSKDGIGPASVTHAVGDGAAFAAVFGEGDDSDRARREVGGGVGFEVGLHPSEGRLGGVVSRAVVYKEDFPAEGGVVYSEKVDGFGEHEGEPEGLIVGGDNDGDVDRGIRGRGGDCRVWEVVGGVWKGPGVGDLARGGDCEVGAFRVRFLPGKVGDQEEENVELWWWWEDC